MERGGYQSDLSIDEKVMMAIVRAAELFKKEASSIFRNWGLTFSQYNVLRVLDASENCQNTMTNISNIMLVSGANMTGIAKRLERNGFLIRKRDPNDDRIIWLEITPKGRQTLKNISDEKEKNIAKYLMKYTHEEKLQILKQLQSILSYSQFLD